MAAIHAKIYESLLAGCPPVRLSEAWQFVEVHRDARVWAAHPRVAIARLREQFSDDELLQSCVAVRKGDELAPNSKLITRERFVITVRDHNARPCSLLTSAGDLQGDVPLFAFGQDATVRNSLGASTRCLYVTASMQDLALLRSLGLPAAPATDLGQLNRAGLQHLLWLVDGISNGRICKKRLRAAKYEFDHSGHVGSEESRPAEFFVVLLGCELATGRPVIPAQIHAAASYLAKAEQSLEVIWDGVSVWWPTEEELGNLDYRRRLEDVDLVRDFFCAPESLFGVSDFAKPGILPNREKTFVAVFEELVKAEREAETHGDQYVQERVQQKRSEYYQRIDGQLFEPLIETALGSENQRICTLRMQLANVTRIFHRVMPAVHAGLSDSAPPSAGLLPEMTCKQIQSLVSMTIQLVKAEMHVEAKKGRRPSRWWPRS